MQSTPCGIYGDVAELFEGGFEVLDDFLSENVGMGGLSESSRLSKMSSGALSRLTKPIELSGTSDFEREKEKTGLSPLLCLSSTVLLLRSRFL